MKETDQELVSRMLDESISEFETRRILKEIQLDPELHSAYQHYNLIGHAMRGQLPARLNHDFSKEVMSRLSAGPKPDTESPAYGGIHLNTIKAPMGLGIAALVAVFSFVMLQDFIQSNPSASLSPTMVAEHVDEEESQDFILSPEAEEDFNSYIVNHAGYASPRVSMPHVRIVGYNRDYPENGNH